MYSQWDSKVPLASPLTAWPSCHTHLLGLLMFMAASPEHSDSKAREGKGEKNATQNGQPDPFLSLLSKA